MPNYTGEVQRTPLYRRLHLHPVPRLGSTYRTVAGTVPSSTRYTTKFLGRWTGTNEGESGTLRVRGKWKVVVSFEGLRSGPR